MLNQPHAHKNGNIHCSATHCCYHGCGDCCDASSIQVGTEYAVDKSETFCSTFKERTEL